MRFLRVLRFGLVLRRLVRQKFRAESIANERAGFVLRRFGHVGRVGSHVRDQTDQPFRAQRLAFVQALRDSHRAPRGIAQLPTGFLLQRARRERRARLAAALARLHVRHLIRGLFQLGHNRLRLRLVLQIDILPVDLEQLRRKRRAFLRFVLRALLRQFRADRPILDRHKRLNRALALDDQAQRHALHPTGAEAAPNLAPQQRAEFVAHQPIENAAGLLRVHQRHVDVAGMREGVADGRRRDLVKHHALRARPIDPGRFHQMPRDRLAFAIGVGRQVDRVGAIRQRGQFLHHFFLFIGHAILRREVMLDIHRQRRAQ